MLIAPPLHEAKILLHQMPQSPHGISAINRHNDTIGALYLICRNTIALAVFLQPIQHKLQKLVRRRTRPVCDRQNLGALLGQKTGTLGHLTGKGLIDLQPVGHQERGNTRQGMRGLGIIGQSGLKNLCHTENLAKRLRRRIRKIV